MRSIPTTDALREFLWIKNSTELLSEWNGKCRALITCKCYCGNIYTTTVRHIIDCKDPCGCIKKNKKLESLTKFLKETKNIEVISTASECAGRSNDMIKLKCFCGNIFERKVHNIKNRANSCGCLMYQYESGNKSYQWKGVGELSAHMFHSIKSGAKSRNIEFNITIDDAWNIFLIQDRKCALSGVLLEFNTNHLDRNHRTASLDRIDSEKGYVKGNIHWIHKTLNKMKMDLQLFKFINMCRLINDPISNVTVNKSVNIVPHNYKFNGYKNINNTKFKAIKRGAINRNLCFDITIVDMWNKFVEQNGYCALTGLPIEFKYKADTASLDRIDSSIGYTINNIQWVHRDVNTKLKQTLTEKELQHWCSLVCDHMEENTHEN